jgi:hypothetical protein
MEMAPRVLSFPSVPAVPFNVAMSKWGLPEKEDTKSAKGDDAFIYPGVRFF